MPVSAEEKLEILALLSQDSDETIRNTAYYALQTWSSPELQQLLRNPQTSPAVLDFVSIYLAPQRPELVQSMLENPELPHDIRSALESLHPSPAAGSGGSLTEAPKPIEPVAEEAGDHKRETLLQKLNAMSPAEKIKTALTGNMEERFVLIRDSNKLVARAVLGSPKITDQEIESFAAMKNVTEEVLRLISMNRKFIKNYHVALQLINNPRTPLDVGLPLIHRLNDRDMKNLTLNKNVSETLRGMALKAIKQKQEAAKPKLPVGKH